MEKEEKRYNVLIVDDEIFIRNGLAEIFARKYRKWNLIGSASSYEEACIFFSQEHIDLLITDIQMPEKSGLELIEELRKSSPELEIIIISGYDNFAYARRAMSNKVVHYLLKPINLEEFDTAISQVEQSLSNRESASNIEEIRNIQYTNSIINDVLNGNTQAEQVLLPLLDKVLLPYALICIDIYQNGSSPCTIDSLQTTLHNLLKETGAEFFSKCLVFFRNRQLWNLIIPGKDYHNAYAFALKLKESLYNQYSIHTVFGVSTVSSYAAEFSECFRQAYIAARSMPSDSVKLPFYQFDSLNYSDNRIFDTDAEIRLLNTISTGNQTQTGQVLHDFLDCTLNNNPDIFTLTKIIQSLSYSILKTMEKTFPLDAAFFDLFEALQDLSSIHTRTQLYETVSAFTAHCCRMFESKYSERQSRIVQYIMQYIQEFYYQDLSLDLLAEKVEVSPNYLSTHFKTETGMNLVEYLTFIRLEKAKELLQNTHIKIHQIADEIGYHDVKYFNRIFKKNIGVTPNEYRHISRLHPSPDIPPRHL